MPIFCRPKVLGGKEKIDQASSPLLTHIPQSPVAILQGMIRSYTYELYFTTGKKLLYTDIGK